MILYVVHGNTYYDGYGHIENIFGIYTEKYAAEAAKDLRIKELYEKEIARSWRRVVHDELINMRKEKGRNIAEQFEEWDHAIDNIYFDEETGQLMQSVTVPGGDVIQIPYEKEEE